MKSRFAWTLIWIIILFIIVPIGSWIFLRYNTDWRPFGMANKGELILPIRPIPSLDLEQVDGSAVTEKLFRKRWTLITLIQNRCNAVCRQNLYLMRQVQIAQGLEDEKRLRYVLLIKGAFQPAELQAIQKEHPRLKIATMPDQAEEKLLALFVMAESEQDMLAAQRIYLSDPLGNLMMRYEADAKGRGIIMDLERLLKISQIG